MKICFPTEEDLGADSILSNHFGSAPYFVTYDSVTHVFERIDNKKDSHELGQCNPVKTLAANQMELLLVDEIGDSALKELNQAGIRVIQAEAATLTENITLLKKTGLPEFMQQHTCSHGHDHCCSH